MGSLGRLAKDVPTKMVRTWAKIFVAFVGTYPVRRGILY